MSIILSSLNSVNMADYICPPGMISSTIGSIVPAGWIACQGQSMQRTSYPNLFAVIGTTYGSADANTFSIPDLRGTFVRGLDAGRGIDPGILTPVDQNGNQTVNPRSLGSFQNHAMQLLRGVFDVTNGYSDNCQTLLTSSGAFWKAGTSQQKFASARISQNTAIGDLIFDASRVARVAGETRPHNFAVTFMMKI